MVLPFLPVVLAAKIAPPRHEVGLWLAYSLAGNADIRRAVLAGFPIVVEQGPLSNPDFCRWSKQAVTHSWCQRETQADGSVEVGTRTKQTFITMSFALNQGRRPPPILGVCLGLSRFFAVVSSDGRMAQFCMNQHQILSSWRQS